MRSGFSINDPHSSPPSHPPSPWRRPAPRGKTHQGHNVWPEQDTHNPRSSIFLGSNIQQEICRRIRTEHPLTEVRVYCEHVRMVFAPKPLCLKKIMSDKMWLVAGKGPRPQNSERDEGRFLCYKKIRIFTQKHYQESQKSCLFFKLNRQNHVLLSWFYKKNKKQHKTQSKTKRKRWHLLSWMRGTGRSCKAWRLLINYF